MNINIYWRDNDAIYHKLAKQSLNFLYKYFIKSNRKMYCKVYHFQLGKHIKLTFLFVVVRVGNSYVMHGENLT